MRASMRSLQTRVLAAALALGATACGITSGSDSSEAGSLIVPADTFTLVNRVDIPVEVFLPTEVEDVVVLLREFETNPARAIINYASKAGVPAVGMIYALLPPSLKDRFESWVNAEINKIVINDVSVTVWAGRLAQLAQFAIAKIALESEFDFETKDHRLTALDFSPSGHDLKIEFHDLTGDILTQNTPIAVGFHGRISFGGAHFGLNYGEYIWEGLNALSMKYTGMDLRGFLTAALNCPELAVRVSQRCLGDLCIGNADKIEAICEGGLNFALRFAELTLTPMRLEVLRFKAGDAQLVDDDADGIADRMVEGKWDAEMNGGFGLRPVPATFTGDREPLIDQPDL